VGECFFWYRPTRVVPDQRPLNGRCCCPNKESNPKVKIMANTNNIIQYNQTNKSAKDKLLTNLLIVAMVVVNDLLN